MKSTIHKPSSYWGSPMTQEPFLPRLWWWWTVVLYPSPWWTRRFRTAAPWWFVAGPRGDAVWDWQEHHHEMCICWMKDGYYGVRMMVSNAIKWYTAMKGWYEVWNQGLDGMRGTRNFTKSEKKQSGIYDIYIIYMCVRKIIDMKRRQDLGVSWSSRLGVHRSPAALGTCWRFLLGIQSVTLTWTAGNSAI